MFAVVAPCLGPDDHVIVLMCIPHQIPTYFIGIDPAVLAEDVRRIEVEAQQRRREILVRSASWIVRHGVTNGVLPRTFTPSAHGASAARSVRLSMRGPARNMRA